MMNYQFNFNWVIFVSMIVLSFGFQNKYRTKENINIYEVLTQWRKDTLGNSFRNYRNTNMLVEKLCLQEKSIDEVISLLGKPNKLFFTKDKVLNQIEYFAETNVTAKGELIDTLDYCRAGFIESKKLKVEFSYTCK